MSSDKVGPQHRARKAVLYVRQSSTHQVQHNRESQLLQYAMRDRLVLLGWSEIEVVDDDLGCSAAGGTTRAGFERMVAEPVGFIKMDDRLEMDPDRRVQAAIITRCLSGRPREHAECAVTCTSDFERHSLSPYSIDIQYHAVTIPSTPPLAILMMSMASATYVSS